MSTGCFQSRITPTAKIYLPEPIFSLFQLVDTYVFIWSNYYRHLKYPNKYHLFFLGHEILNIANISRHPPALAKCQSALAFHNVLFKNRDSYPAVLVFPIGIFARINTMCTITVLRIIRKPTTWSHGPCSSLGQGPPWSSVENHVISPVKHTYTNNCVCKIREYNWNLTWALS